jgi:hypothetical protein
METAHRCSYAKVLLAQRRNAAARRNFLEGTAVPRDPGDTVLLESTHRSMREACAHSGISPFA